MKNAIYFQRYLWNTDRQTDRQTSSRDLKMALSKSSTLGLSPARQRSNKSANKKEKYIYFSLSICRTLYLFLSLSPTHSFSPSQERKGFHILIPWIRILRIGSREGAERFGLDILSLIINIYTGPSRNSVPFPENC